jgi:hypothetical protein
MTSSARTIYYIIRASLSTEDLARREVCEKRKEGDNSVGIVIFADSSKYRIYADSCSSKNEALSKLDSVRRNIPDAWILQVNTSADSYRTIIDIPLPPAEFDSLEIISPPVNPEKPIVDAAGPIVPELEKKQILSVIGCLIALIIILLLVLYLLLVRRKKSIPVPKPSIIIPTGIGPPIFKGTVPKNGNPPTGKKEPPEELPKPLSVNYQIDIPENIDNYAIVKFPKEGCVVRSHQTGKTKIRGFKEESFQNSISKYFRYKFEISGDVRFNTGQETRPFEPDIAIIGKEPFNIRIDIEIDEPYAGITRQPTHCKEEDRIRDYYFTDRGWIVIRFSEHQVHTQELGCLKLIAIILNKIDTSFNISKELSLATDLTPENTWDILQAQKWEKENYRENYLNHTFEEIPEKEEPVDWNLTEQELKEEGLVEKTYIDVPDIESIIGFNEGNTHPRDKRVTFYPEPHIYLIDDIPVLSTSTIVSKFFPEFDAWEKARNLGMSNPLYGLPPEEIVRIWEQKGEEAAKLGTYMHEQIEKYYLNQPVEETKELQLFKQFDKDHPIKPFRTEWRIFNEDYNIAGTIDLIVNNGNSFDIYDWKRSKKIIDYWGSPITIDKWGGRGVGKLSDIHDTSYNHYCLQQGLYRYILEKKYGLRISKMYLVVLHPNYDKYYKLEVPYWEDKVEYILKACISIQ